MGQAGGLHEFGDAGAVKSALAKQLRRGVDDPLAIFLGMSAGDAHDAPEGRGRETICGARRSDLIMTAIIVAPIGQATPGDFDVG